MKALASDHLGVIFLTTVVTAAVGFAATDPEIRRRISIAAGISHGPLRVGQQVTLVGDDGGPWAVTSVPNASERYGFVGLSRGDETAMTSPLGVRR